MLHTLARRLPPRIVARLNQAQFDHPIAGRVLRMFATRVAHGKNVIERGPAAGLWIDATGTNSGYVLGTSEPVEQDWLVRHTRAGDVVYDIGANIGFYTLLTARLVAPGGSVYAFEPLPANAEQLSRNIELNGFDHATAIAAAVGASDGAMFLRTDVGRRDSSHVVGASTAEDDVEVRQVAIDTWVAQTAARPPSVMKIDVEGAELDVLKGAMATIQRSLPTLLVEVHWLGTRFVDFVEEKLKPLGYVATTLKGEPLPSEPMRLHAALRSSRASHAVANNR